MTRLVMIATLFPLLLGSEAAMPLPRYTEKGRLIRPEGYREWMFAGANLGMGYSEALKSRTMYHNIYVQREAYKQYVATGSFPDKTMLVMEVLYPGTNASINRQGSFEDKLAGIEVALKDETRFAEKWAYFNFIGEGDKPLPDAVSMKKEQCWNCHNEHGAADNVFVQFYPALRDARKPSR